jgi:hypothetical protein
MAIHGAEFITAVVRGVRRGDLRSGAKRHDALVTHHDAKRHGAVCAKKCGQHKISIHRSHSLTNYKYPYFKDALSQVYSCISTSS